MCTFFFFFVKAYGVRFEMKYPPSCPHPKKKVGQPWDICFLSHHPHCEVRTYCSAV